MMHGYGGRILRVDLSSRRIIRERTDPAYMLAALGGRGLNIRRLCDELDPASDPLGPDNMLLLGVGPLTGSLLPASGFTAISGKSPLTGLPGAGMAGGFLGPEIKAAGYDQIVITGRAEKPCYLLIVDDHVEIKAADHLHGLDTRATVPAIRREINDNLAQVAAIGPAGENLVKFAAVADSRGRLSGRGSPGCLFGAKNLKAVAVRGTGMTTLADPLSFLDLCRTMEAGILDRPDLQRRSDLGSTGLMTDLNDLGILPTRHFQAGVCEYIDRISGEALTRKYKPDPKSCFNCPVHCHGYLDTPDFRGEAPGFESLCALTARLDNADLEYTLRLNELLAGLGIDPAGFAETMGWAMECVELGLLGPADLDGLDFSWGNRDTVEKVAHLTARRQGIGAWFADGVRRLAARFGPDCERYAFQVKGEVLPGVDPRGLKAYGLSIAVAAGGIDHIGVAAFLEEARHPNTADRLSNEGQAALVDRLENRALLLDSLTLCRDIGLDADCPDMETASRLLIAGTGLKFTPDGLEAGMQQLLVSAENLDRGCGRRTGDDTLPSRFTDEALAKGKSRGHVVPISKMVGEYYRSKGRDKS